MTTKMYNLVKKNCTLASYPDTFATLLKILLAKTDCKGMTAKQIGAVLELMYAQKAYGENQMYMAWTS